MHMVQKVIGKLKNKRPRPSLTRHLSLAKKLGVHGRCAVFAPPALCQVPSPCRVLLELLLHIPLRKRKIVQDEDKLSPVYRLGKTACRNGS